MGTRVLDAYLARHLALIYSRSQFFIPRCASVSQSMSAKLGHRLVTPAGSCTAWSMEYSLMVRCHPTRLLAVETIHSTPSSQRLGQASMFQGLSLLIQSPLSLMRFVPEPTGNCFTPNS